MSIITFWNGTDDEVGNTTSSMAFATQVAIEHNIKVLLLSTSLNDSLIKDSFWQENRRKSFGFFADNRSKIIENNGLEGLERVIRSNRITPEMIKDYTRVVLKDRLEILLGLEGDGEIQKKQYAMTQERYPEIMELADRYYDMVIVDLDKNIKSSTRLEILQKSHIIVAMTSQKVKSIQKIDELIKQNNNILNEENTVMAIGKYMENTRYNAKNITRGILRKRDIINTIPYNNLLFEATQEGKIIDLYFNFIRLREKDENYYFVKEIKRLYADIKGKIEMLQMQRKI